MKIDTWSLVAELKDLDNDSTELVIRNRKGEVITLTMKHDSTKPGCVTEVIEDLTKIIAGLKEYEKFIGEKM